MKKIGICLLGFCLLGILNLKAQLGDTIAVQTMTFGSPQDAWFVFPSDTVRFEKILMEYTLKCNPAQSPACGEWDVSTHTFVYEHTGLLDSTVTHQSTYSINGLSPDSISYMNSPSYSYAASWQYNMAHTDTTFLNLYPVGTGSISANAPFGTSNPISRSQYLWKGTEMNLSGMVAGNITGLRFFLQSIGGQLNHLTVRIKASSVDSVTTSSFSSIGFTTVYSGHTLFASSGWNSLQLTTPFNWNGTSNLLIEFMYDNLLPSLDNNVASSNTGFQSGLTHGAGDRIVSFHDYGKISIPINSRLAALDSFVTVSYWAYGTPEYQPMDGTSFFAQDSSGSRILNVHMPWSDSNVYWDAGSLSGSYDRISKSALPAEIEGKWNYWVFTKNVATGSMKIYLNGVLWHSGSGKPKRMRNMAAFNIGNDMDAHYVYEGKMDDFAVFNKELSASTILNYMNRSIDPSHPNYSDLLVYYHFDDGNYLNATDLAAGGHDPALFQSVDNPLKSSSEILTDFVQTSIRPNIIFEQGSFVSHLDSTLVVDSTVNAPLQIIFYNDSLSNSGIATDTLIVWPSYYNNYVYDPLGNAIDSILVMPDSTLHLDHYDWYEIFPEVNRYELARYITPYGNGLSLGSGFKWTFDVSDYRTLLSDSVHLSAGNWQELLDLKFLMIKGIPPRDIIDIENVYSGSFNYGISSDPIENHFIAKNFSIPLNVHGARWKSRLTGHGFGGTGNCAEFCPKNHYYKVNGIQQFSHLLWRDNCDLNPLYPQGGTWLYDRANWCPGAEVSTSDFELTPFITAGGTLSLDHDVESYTWNGVGTVPAYLTEEQLVTYGSPNFSLDAALEDVLSPSSNQMWLRYNPICTNPIIRIKNTGTTPLTSLTITYGLVGASPSVYTWNGNLAFMQSEEIVLGNFNWVAGGTDFNVTISSPNGGTDQYSFNNSKTTHFVFPPLFPQQIIIDFKTNNFPSENFYSLKDENGNIIHSRNGSSLLPNTLYRDTLSLPNGCYEFELTDTGEDGLTWWANTAQGNGYIRFRKVTPYSTLKNFNSDFGGQVYQQFTVGLTTDTEDYIVVATNSLSVYPNPSNGHVSIDINLSQRLNGNIEVVDVLGNKVYEYKFENQTAESVEADLSSLKKGMYFVCLKTKIDQVAKKIIIE